jgi:hypothetical protein
LLALSNGQLVLVYLRFAVALFDLDLALCRLVLYVVFLLDLCFTLSPLITFAVDFGGAVYVLRQVVFVLLLLILILVLIPILVIFGFYVIAVLLFFGGIAAK